MVDVHCMSTRARDMPTGPAIHAWWMTTRVVMPTRADSSWPPRKLRGCDILLSSTANTSTAAAGRQGGGAGVCRISAGDARKTQQADTCRHACMAQEQASLRCAPGTFAAAPLSPDAPKLPTTKAMSISGVSH